MSADGPDHEPGREPGGPRPVTGADRERIRARLRDLMGQGRISLADYQARLRRVAAATTAGELDAVMRDLPAPPEHREEPGGGGTAPAPEAGTRDDERREERGGGRGGAPREGRGPSTDTLRKLFLVVVALGVLLWALTYFLGR